jgi:hypothetical protein
VLASKCGEVGGSSPAILLFFCETCIGELGVYLSGAKDTTIWVPGVILQYGEQEYAALVVAASRHRDPLVQPATKRILNSIADSWRDLAHIL